MIHPANLDQSLRKRSVFVPIAVLSAGADAADIALMRCPCALEIIAVNIIPQGDDAGIDGSNTSAWLIEYSTTTLASKTYSNTVAFPDAGVVSALTLTATTANLKRAEGDVITYSITNGNTAATPASIVEIEYVVLDEAIFDTQHAISNP